MKRLVGEYHSIDIRQLSREGWLCPYSEFEWAWKVSTSTKRASVMIAVLTDALRIIYPMGTDRVHQRVVLTHSHGHRGGERFGLSARAVDGGLLFCIMLKGYLFVAVNVATSNICRSIPRVIAVTAGDIGA
jgi:hypothetical protein